MTEPLKAGDRLRVALAHQVDADDDDTARYADENDEAEVVSAFQHANGEPYYQIGFPGNGATGFYDADELDKMFVRAAT
jgi:hypothetical protein